MNPPFIMSGRQLSLGGVIVFYGADIAVEQFPRTLQGLDETFIPAS